MKNKKNKTGMTNNYKNTNSSKFTQSSHDKNNSYNSSLFIRRNTIHYGLKRILPKLKNRDFIYKDLISSEILNKQRTKETCVYGRNACQALFQRRPKSIIRAWFIHDTVFLFKEILCWLSKNHKAYHIVDAFELSRIASTKHHGGVCFLIKKRNGITVQQWINRKSQDDCVIALENVGNPHNLGAIVRSCAHFGIKGILLQDISLLESGAAIRTAEGGSEYVQPIIENDIVKACKYFRKAGYSIITTSSHKGLSLFKVRFPRRVVLVLGQECNGLSDIMLSLSDLQVSIYGTGSIESLNVSVSAGIVLSEWWRQKSKEYNCAV